MSGNWGILHSLSHITMDLLLCTSTPRSYATYPSRCLFRKFRPICECLQFLPPHLVAIKLRSLVNRIGQTVRSRRIRRRGLRFNLALSEEICTKCNATMEITPQVIPAARPIFAFVRRPLERPELPDGDAEDDEAVALEEIEVLMTVALEVFKVLMIVEAGIGSVHPDRRTPVLTGAGVLPEQAYTPHRLGSHSVAVDVGAAVGLTNANADTLAAEHLSTKLITNSVDSYQHSNS